MGDFDPSLSPLPYGHPLAPSPSSQMGIQEAEIYIDVVACVIAGMLVLRFAIGVTPYRLWRNSKVCKLVLWAVDNALYQWSSSGILILLDSAYNELYLIWAVLFIIALDNVVSISGYSLFNSPDVRINYELVLLLDNVIVASYISQNPHRNHFNRVLWVFWGVSVLNMLRRIVVFHEANRCYGPHHTSLIADYMTYEHQLSEEEVVDPIHMRGYNYLVTGEAKAEAHVTPPSYVTRLKMTKVVVTTDKVWRCGGRLLSSHGDPEERLKDVCLSFAMFKLVKRRLTNHPASESKFPKTRDFVFEGLLSGDRPERVFRVISTELGFLHDLLYTKYPIIFATGFPFLKIAFLLATIVAGSMAYPSVKNYKAQKDGHYLSIHGSNVDIKLTGVLIIFVVLLEVWEFINILFSDWAKVMMISNYVKSPRWLPNLPGFHMLLGTLGRIKFATPLGDKMGQYCLLLRFHKHSTGNLVRRLACGFLGDKKSHGMPMKKIKVSAEVKQTIFLSLKANQGLLSNGASTLSRYEVENQLSWACRLPKDAHTIMVWHIATTFCQNDMELSNKHQDENINSLRSVAVSLSNYCAYLVVFVPDLLSDSSYSTTKMFDSIVMETREFFKGRKTLSSKHRKMIEVGNSEETIIGMGSRLGNHLVFTMEDEAQRWKLLGDFWAELILYLAPSDKAHVHAEKLGTGGEFITHLWALLYHAGILERRPSSVSQP